MTINEGYAQQSIKNKVSELFKINLTPQQHQLHEAHAESQRAGKQQHTNNCTTAMLATGDLSTVQFQHKTMYASFPVISRVMFCLSLLNDTQLALRHFRLHTLFRQESAKHSVLALGRHAI